MRTIDDFARNFRDESAFRYSVHVSEEFGFVYFSTPKAGCSTTKATLNLACARKLGRALRYETMAEIHSRAHNILKTPDQVGERRFLAMIEDPAVAKFCILREPVGRVCSAFASKFRGRNSPHRQRLNARTGRPADADWDINMFAAAIASDPALRDLDEHWKSQYRHLCAALVEFTHVGFQEELDADLRAFLDAIFGPGAHEIYDVRSRFPKNVSQSGVAAAALTAQSRETLRAAYADDIAFYARERMRLGRR
jgi:Sulfotransferase family